MHHSMLKTMRSICTSANKAGRLLGAGPSVEKKKRTALRPADYDLRFRRRTRSVLAPKGSRSSAPAIIVVGSGTAET